MHSSTAPYCDRDDDAMPNSLTALSLQMSSLLSIPRIAISNAAETIGLMIDFVLSSAIRLRLATANSVTM